MNIQIQHKIAYAVMDWKKWPIKPVRPEQLYKISSPVTVCQKTELRS